MLVPVVIQTYLADRLTAFFPETPGKLLKQFFTYIVHIAGIDA